MEGSCTPTYACKRCITYDNSCRAPMALIEILIWSQQDVRQIYIYNIHWSLIRSFCVESMVDEGKRIPCVFFSTSIMTSLRHGSDGPDICSQNEWAARDRHGRWTDPVPDIFIRHISPFLLTSVYGIYHTRPCSSENLTVTITSARDLECRLDPTFYRHIHTAKSHHRLFLGLEGQCRGQRGSWFHLIIKLD